MPTSGFLGRRTAILCLITAGSFGHRTANFCLIAIGSLGHRTANLYSDHYLNARVYSLHYSTREGASLCYFMKTSIRYPMEASVLFHKEFYTLFRGDFSIRSFSALFHTSFYALFCAGIASKKKKPTINSTAIESTPKEALPVICVKTLTKKVPITAAYFPKISKNP